MPPEIYMEDALYDVLVRVMTRQLRKPEKRSGDNKLRALAQLKLAGLDTGFPVITGSEIKSPIYVDLVEVLASHKPCPGTGRLEEWQVVAALGNVGNIWPASVSPDRGEAIAA